jgi:hypothetical protein
MKSFKEYLTESKSDKERAKASIQLSSYFELKVKLINRSFSSTKELYDHYRDIMVDCIKKIFPDLYHVTDEENNNLIHHLVAMTKDSSIINQNSSEHVTKHKIYPPEQFSYALDFSLKNYIPTIKLQLNIQDNAKDDKQINDRYKILKTLETFLCQSLNFLMKSKTAFAETQNNSDKGLFRELSDRHIIPDLYTFTINDKFNIIKSNNVDYFIWNIPKSVKDINKNLNLSGRQLSEFPIYLPNINGDFDCNSNNLTSLKGSPKEVHGHFTCSSNRLKNLSFAPTVVDGNFDCVDNRLTSLKGAPTNVGWNFDCSYNLLNSLKWCPKKVEGDFNCSNNVKKFTKEDVQSVCDVKGKIIV